MNLPNMLEAKKRSKKEVKTTSYFLDDKYVSIGKNKKYYLKTYGCQMNEHDSENIRAILESASFTETES